MNGRGEKKDERKTLKEEREITLSHLFQTGSE